MKQDAQCMERTQCVHFIQLRKMFEAEGYLFRLIIEYGPSLFP